MVSESPLLQVNDISLAFGGVKALTDVSFHVNEKEIFFQSLVQTVQVKPQCSIASLVDTHQTKAL